MKNRQIQGKTIEEWAQDNQLKAMMETEPVFWVNPNYLGVHENLSLFRHEMEDARQRLERFAPYLARVFPETEPLNGMIESSLVRLPAMKRELEKRYGLDLPGNLLLKCDSHLPISGSIKARGGIYEVLKHAEELAVQNHLLKWSDDYSVLQSDQFRQFFSRYSIAVGSTGNLGMSIGIMGAQLGFKVTVHMSMDAKQWKKDLLRSKGVQVLEYADDYSKAVEEGRRQAGLDPACHFIDDEQSRDLFFGYSAAGYEVKRQLDEMNIKVDDQHPLFVYLPCGVGGGPGGVAFGLKQMFQENVHCFFAEPTHSPCMLLGLMTGLHEQVCVQDFGIDNRTEADGLAVGRPSGFVSQTMKPMLSGVYTVSDSCLYELLAALADTEKIFVEPSAVAGMPGPVRLLNTEDGRAYIAQQGLQDRLANATHIVWATGGSMVPEEIMAAYYKKGTTVVHDKKLCP